MAGRSWLRKDRDLFCAQYGTRPLAELSVLLGRSEAALHQLAWRLGLQPKRARLNPALAGRLARLHARGLSIRAIARRVGLCPSTCCRYLTRLGLAPPCSPGPDPAALARQARTRKHLARSWGYRSWSSYLLSRRRLRYDACYPGCATRWQAAVCLLLENVGPHSRPEIVSMLGKPARPAHRARAALAQLLVWEMIRQDEFGLYHLVRRR